MKKRILSILLAAIMLVSLLPATAFAETGTTVEVSTWEEFRNAARREDESLTIKLTNNITASGSYTYGDAWEIFGGKTRVFDLNNYTFDLNKYHLFCIHDATVTIKNGTITNGNGNFHKNFGGFKYNETLGYSVGYAASNENSGSGDGGAIYIDNGTVTLEDLTITGCTASRGFGYGGAIYCEGGNVTLDDVTIKNCSATRGGAIYVGGYKTVTIKGNSKIGVENAGNTAETGGGICISGNENAYNIYGNLPTLNLRDNTEIRYNTATKAYNPGTDSARIETNQTGGGGGGVAVYPRAYVTFGDSVKITDNTAPRMSQRDSDVSALSENNNLFIVSDYSENGWHDSPAGFNKAWRIGFAAGADAPVYSGDNKMQVGVTLGTSNTTIGASSFKWTSEGIFSDNTAIEEYVACFIPDFNDRKVSINSSNELLIGEVHGHSFTYTVSGASDAIMATCTGSCDEGYNSSPLILALVAGGTYSGSPIAASLTNKDAFVEATRKTIGEIAYYLSDGTTATTSDNSGATTEGAAPVNVGSYVAKVTVNDINNENVTLTTPFAITQATAEITKAPTASAITYGDTLSASELSGGTANVNGSFAWKEGTTVPKVSDSNKTEYVVIFTPTDTMNYTTVECKVTLQVVKKAVTVKTVPVEDKVYNGKNDAVIDNTEITLDGVVTGDELTISGVTGTYASANASDTQGVTLNASSNWTLGGSDAGNYVLATEDQPGTTTGKITALDLSGATVTLEPTEENYTGSEITGLTVTVEDSDGNVIPSDDYTVSYSNNTNAGTATVTVTATGNNVTGSKDATFTINKIPSAITANPQAIANLVYTGVAQPLVTAPDSTEITGGTLKYKLGTETAAGGGEWSADIPTGIDAGDYYVWYKVAGDQNHDDTEPQKVKVSIERKEISIIWDPRTRTYDGTDQGNDIAAKYMDINNGENMLVVSINGVFKNAGNYTATVTDFDPYDTGSKNYKLPADPTKTYTMNPKPVTVTAVPVENKVYDGNNTAGIDNTNIELTGVVEGDQVTISGVTGTYADANIGSNKEITLNASTQWTLGGAAKGNYTLAVEGNLTKTSGDITAFALSGATVTVSPDTYDYTGSAFTPTPTVTFDGTSPIPAADYTVSYVDNINAGTATVTVTAKGNNVTGSKSATFTINKIAPPEGTPNAYEVNAAVYSELSLGTIGVTLQGAKITKVEAVSGKTGKVLSAAPAIISDGAAISWTTKDSPSGTINDQYKLTVSTENWTDFTITVDFEGKIPVTFSGLTTVGNVTYDGQPETGVTGTAVCTAGGQDVTEGCGTLVYTYYKDSVAEANKLNDAPIDAGSYVLLVSVADSNTTYIGTSSQFEFTIAEKEIEIEWAEDEFTYKKEDQTALITASYKDVAEGSHALVVVVKKGGEETAFMNAGNYTAKITGFDTEDTGSKNYTIPSADTKAYTMKQATVTVKDIAVQDKVYDGKTDNVIFTGAATFEGRFGDDDLKLDRVTGVYYSAERSGNQRVDLTNGYTAWSLTGAAAANYQLAESGHVAYVFGKILQASQSAPSAPEVSGDKVTIAEADRERNLEYCVDDSSDDNAKAWISVPTLDNGTFTLAGLSAGNHTIYLRVKESNNYAASASVNTAFTLTQFSVAYNANGGIGSIASQTATAPATLTVASGSGFSRTGYSFTGWNTASDGRGTSYAVGASISSGATLYAQWTANTYKVNFNANGGTGTMGDQSFTYDEEPKALTAKPEGFKKDGYTFVGWATSSNGPVLYSNQQEVKNLVGNGTVTLYAVWTQAAYSITVNVSSPNNGNEVKIELRQGNAVYASTTANSMTTTDDVLWTDSKTFANVPAGTYNVEATQVIEGSKNVTMTQLVVLTAEALTVDIALPESGINSTLEVTKDTLPTVVGGLDVEAEFNRQYGKDITVAMTVEKQEAQELAATAGAEDKATQAAIKEIKATANGKTLDFMNIEVKKTTVESGQPDVTEAITETSNVLELVFSYEMNGKKNIQLYREHDGAVLTFEKLETKPTTDYEDGKFYVDTTNSLIYVYAKQFSTYAIGYEQVYSGGGSSSYAIESESVKNGTVSVDKKSAYAGSTVTITVTPDKGFTLETLTVLDKNGKEIEVKNLGNNKYSFKMPASKVTVSATFMEDNTMLNFFVDVKANDYFYDAVLWAAENGITQGTDAVHFSPNMGTTRAQVVTFLWRAAGCPEPNGDASKFTDVVVGSYYEKAVAWAIEQGITKGTTETTFSPYVVCTRGQIVTFLARFAGVADEAAGYTHGFTDVKATDYFNNAVAWAKDNKVTEGTSAATFSPKQDCTRAQVVTFLYRWMVK